jgi:heat shock protein HtpX
MVSMSNGVKTVLLLGTLSGLLLVIGDVVAGPSGLMYGLILAAVMNLGSLPSDKIVLGIIAPSRSGGIRSTDDGTAVQGGLLMPKVPDPHPSPMPRDRA